MKQIRQMPSGWEKDALTGAFLIRDGTDYVNNRDRYGQGEKKLQDALEATDKSASASASPIDIARIHLWLGICANENLSKGTPHTRNSRAVELYTKGLGHIRYTRGPLAVPVRMALYNSLGVAHHHGNKDSDEIPVESFKAYRRARDIFRKYPELKTKLTPIMNKVAQNSGGRVKRGGDRDASLPMMGGNIVHV